MGPARGRDHRRRDVLLPLRRAVPGAARDDPAGADRRPGLRTRPAHLECGLLHGGRALFPGDPGARTARRCPARLAGLDPRNRHQHRGAGHRPRRRVRPMGPADDAAGGPAALLHPSAGRSGHPARGRLRPAAGIPRTGPVRAGQPAHPCRPRPVAGRAVRPDPLPERADLLRGPDGGRRGARSGPQAAAGRVAAARPRRAESRLRELPRRRQPARHRGLPPSPRGAAARPGRRAGGGSAPSGATGGGAVRPEAQPDSDPVRRRRRRRGRRRCCRSRPEPGCRCRSRDDLRRDDLRRDGPPGRLVGRGGGGRARPHPHARRCRGDRRGLAGPADRAGSRSHRHGPALLRGAAGPYPRARRRGRAGASGRALPRPGLRDGALSPRPAADRAAAPARGRSRPRQCRRLESSPRPDTALPEGDGASAGEIAASAAAARAALGVTDSRRS